MPNQYSQDSKPFMLRLPESLKAEIQAAVDQLNQDMPAASVSVSSFIRQAIIHELARIKKAKK